MKKSTTKIILSVIFALLAIGSYAQNELSKTDDIGRIVLTPYVISNANIPSYAESVLNNKLAQIAAKQGMAGNSIDTRFVITASLSEISKDFTPTTPPMIALTLSPTIYIGDGISGELFSSCEVPPVKGVGENETKAYLSAIKAIKTNNPAIVQCIEDGKVKIVEYYNSQIDFILAEAESLSRSQNYDEAMMLLSTVPDVCKEAYEKAMQKISVVYQTKIDTEGAALYNEAYALWKSNKSKETALKVVELLAQINPLSSAAKQGRTLVASVESHWAEIEARRRELEERAWAFKMKQYDDSQAEKTAQREMDHEYRMQESSFDYEVQMKRAETGVDAANLALQEVKSVVKTMSTGKSGDRLNLTAKISSWFK